SASFPATNIKTEIHFLEIGVKRNRQMAEQLGVAEAKANQANVGASVERIQRGARRDVRIQKTWFNLVVQHHEVTPFSGKENPLRVGRSLDTVTDLPDPVHPALNGKFLSG